MTSLPRFSPFDIMRGGDLNQIIEAIDGGQQGKVTIRDASGNATVQNGIVIAQGIQSDPYVPVSGARGTFSLDDITGFQFWDSNSNRVVFIDILTGNTTLGNGSSAATLTMQGGSIYGGTIATSSTVGSPSGVNGGEGYKITGDTIKLYNRNGLALFTFSSFMTQNFVDIATLIGTAAGFAIDTVLLTLQPPGSLGHTTFPNISSVTPTGGTGSTTYYYRVVPTYVNSDDIPSPPVQITNGVGVLSGTQYNAVTFLCGEGTQYHYILRSTDNVNWTQAGIVTTEGNSAGVAVTFNDTGSSSGYTPRQTKAGGVMVTATDTGGTGFPWGFINIDHATRLVYGDLYANPVETPFAPIVNAGTVGITTYSYYTVAVYVDGAGNNRDGPASPVTTITNGPATLSTTNFNNVEIFASGDGIRAQRVIRSAGGPSQGQIAIISPMYNQTFKDTGLAATAYTATTAAAGGNVKAIAFSAAGQGGWTNGSGPPVAYYIATSMDNGTALGGTAFYTNNSVATPPASFGAYTMIVKVAGMWGFVSSANTATMAVWDEAGGNITLMAGDNVIKATFTVGGQWESFAIFGKKQYSAGATCGFRLAYLVSTANLYVRAGIEVMLVPGAV